MFRLIVICVAIAFSHSVYSEEIPAEDVWYETESYYSGGDEVACGVRFLAINHKHVLLNATVTFASPPGKLPQLMMKVLARKLTDRSSFSGRNIEIAEAWLRTPKIGLFRPDLSYTEGDGLVKISRDMDMYFPAMMAVLDGRFTIGFQEQGEMVDQVYEISAKMPDEEWKKWDECFEGVFANVEQAAQSS